MEHKVAPLIDQIIFILLFLQSFVTFAGLKKIYPSYFVLRDACYTSEKNRHLKKNL